MFEEKIKKWRSCSGVVHAFVAAASAATATASAATASAATAATTTKGNTHVSGLLCGATRGDRHGRVLLFGLQLYFDFFDVKSSVKSRRSRDERWHCDVTHTHREKGDRGAHRATSKFFPRCLRRSGFLNVLLWVHVLAALEIIEIGQTSRHVNGARKWGSLRSRFRFKFGVKVFEALTKRRHNNRSESVIKRTSYMREFPLGFDCLVV